MRVMVSVVGRAVLLLALVFVFALLAAGAGAQVPLATPWDEAHAQLAIDARGTTVTVRSPAPDALRLCVEPRAFGPTRCYTVGALRRGEVR